jgi:hypothetical protein
MTEIFMEIWIQSIILGNYITTYLMVPTIIVCSLFVTIFAVTFMRGSR